MTTDEAQALMTEYYQDPEPQWRYGPDGETKHAFWVGAARGFRSLASAMRADSAQNRAAAEHWDTLALAAETLAEVAR